MKRSTNKLAAENSLYLQQHADNPVEWYPWGQEAFDRARTLNKPILLSVGYAACHWCHVMAEESFADQVTAEIMNQYFINIKVDREERPDLDKIYQTALQLLTGKAGGWPLTMFLIPDRHIPFFGGTYFPNHAGFGTPSFREVLQQVHRYFTENLEDAQNIANKIASRLQQLTDSPKKTDVVLSLKPLSLARVHSKEAFDNNHGGFGSAPKFPMPTVLTSLMNDINSIDIVSFTLEKMAKGGIYDQIGGGFYRYSVDASWMIPHFEKMIYDNAALLILYSQMYVVNMNTLFKNVVLETGAWVLREMQSRKGGFYATLNADTEGVEGKFYVWDRDQIKDILTKDEYKVAALYYNLEMPANFNQLWHLHQINSPDEISKKLNFSSAEVERYIAALQKKLFDYRETRVPPSCDKKILPGWNAMMIKALIVASRSVDHYPFIEAAQAALNCINKYCWRDRHLAAVYYNDPSDMMAYLDDYVFLLDAIITLLQSRWSNKLLQFAIEITESLYELFYDKGNGGFFFTANNHEELIQRPKLFIDESIPSGNGIAALCCLRLGHMLGEEKYCLMAKSTLQVAWDTLNEYPSVYYTLLFALEEFCNPPTIIILRGPSEALFSWQQVFFHHYCPHHLCFAIGDDIEVFAAPLNKPKAGGSVFAYICSGRECQATINSHEAFTDYLKSVSIGDKFRSNLRFE